MRTVALRKEILMRQSLYYKRGMTDRADFIKGENGWHLRKKIRK